MVLNRGECNMGYQKITIAGCGLLGSQIAMQAAYCGIDVTVWLRTEESKKRAQMRLDDLKIAYVEEIEKMQTMKKGDPAWSNGIADFDTFDPMECIEKVNHAYSSIKMELDLAKAVEGADLVIESISEDFKAKSEFFQKLAPYIKDSMGVVTNASTIIPSLLGKYTGHEDRFLTLHFMNRIWRKNPAEIMGTDKTSPEFMQEIEEFSKQIRMVPLHVKKEKAGLITNSMLIPFLLSAMDLCVNNISDFETINKAWKAGTGAPMGPFETIDLVGLRTTRNVAKRFLSVPGIMTPLLKKMMFPYNFRGMNYLLDKYLLEGREGLAAGKGFFDYHD